MSGDMPRRERKVVTVVFCDLVGFTSRAESLDPEDVEAILRPARRPPAAGRRADAEERASSSAALAFYRSFDASASVAQIESALAGAQSASA